MPRITISYRRDDSMVMTGRIFDRLAAHYGKEAVFRDIDNIPPGVDFRKHIDLMLDESDIVLAIVGPKWVGPRAGASRIANAADPVRVEIETVLRKDKPLIPVLVQRASMPRPDQLPETMQDFAFRNAVDIDAGRDFDHHIAGLLRAMDRILGLLAEAEASDQVERTVALTETAPRTDGGTADQSSAEREPIIRDVEASPVNVPALLREIDSLREENGALEEKLSMAEQSLAAALRQSRAASTDELLSAELSAAKSANLQFQAQIAALSAARDEKARTAARLQHEVQAALLNREQDAKALAEQLEAARRDTDARISEVQAQLAERESLLTSLLAARSAAQLTDAEDNRQDRHSPSPSENFPKQKVKPRKLGSAADWGTILLNIFLLIFGTGILAMCLFMLYSSLPVR